MFTEILNDRPGLLVTIGIVLIKITNKIVIDTMTNVKGPYGFTSICVHINVILFLFLVLVKYKSLKVYIPMVQKDYYFETNKDTTI